MPTPLAQWPVAWLAGVTGFLAVGLVTAAMLIQHNDTPLRAAGIEGSSGALEWPFSPETSRTMVKQYRDNNVVTTVVHGVALDSFLFVPSYAALLLVACFWAARGAAEPYATAWRVLGWGAVVAGGLDLIENAGILVQLLLGWSFAAPFTAVVCRLKWLLALTAAFSLPFRAVVAWVS